MDLVYTYSCCGKTIEWKGTKKAYDSKVKQNRKCNSCANRKLKVEGTYFKMDSKGKNRRYITFDCIECKETSETRYDSYKRNKTRYCRRCAVLKCGKQFETTHGISSHPIYKTWSCMKSRCLRPTNDNYKWYGGRGIKICDEWMDVITFYKWSIDNGWSNGLELDRINNNGNYEPTNCQWITHKENVRKQWH